MFPMFVVKKDRSRKIGNIRVDSAGFERREECESKRIANNQKEPGSTEAGEILFWKVILGRQKCAASAYVRNGWKADISVVPFIRV